MSYEKHTWVNNEVISASKLNNIEDGIEEASQSGGSGFDAVVYVYHDNESSHSYEVTIESGSFASLSAILSDNQPPFILVKIWDELLVLFGTTSVVAIYTIDESFIDFRPKVPTAQNGGSTSSDVVRGFSMVWNSNDTINFYAS